MLGRKQVQALIRLTTLSISQGSVSLSLGGDPPELTIWSGTISVLENIVLYPGNSAVPHDPWQTKVYYPGCLDGQFDAYLSI